MSCEVSTSPTRAVPEGAVVALIAGLMALRVTQVMSAQSTEAPTWIRKPAPTFPLGQNASPRFHAKLAFVVFEAQDLVAKLCGVAHESWTASTR